MESVWASMPGWESLFHRWAHQHATLAGVAFVLWVVAARRTRRQLKPAAVILAGWALAAFIGFVFVAICNVEKSLSEDKGLPDTAGGLEYWLRVVVFNYMASKGFLVFSILGLSLGVALAVAARGGPPPGPEPQSDGARVWSFRRAARWTRRQLKPAVVILAGWALGSVAGLGLLAVSTNLVSHYNQLNNIPGGLDSWFRTLFYFYLPHGAFIGPSLIGLGVGLMLTDAARPGPEPRSGGCC
jgi:hypothetical protein